MKLLGAASLVVLVAACGPATPRISAQEQAHLTEEFVVACTMIKPYPGGADRDTLVDVCRCTHREALKRFDVRQLHTGILGGEGPKPADLVDEFATCVGENPPAGAAP